MRTSFTCCVTFYLIAFAISADIENSKICREHEHFYECFSRCEEKCEGVKECQTGCFPGCGCDYGYARNDNSGRCVRSSECPQKCNPKYSTA